MRIDPLTGRWLLRLLASGLVICLVVRLGAQDQPDPKEKPKQGTGIKPGEDPQQPAPQPQEPKPKQQESSRLLSVKSELLFPVPTEKVIYDTMNVSDIGKIAFVIKMKNGQERVALNGKPQKPYATIVPIELLAAAQNLSDQQRAQLRASRGALAQLLKFTPSQERVFYTAYTGKGYVIAADNYESRVYDFIMDNMPVFSPNSKKVAFAAGRSGRWFIVVNDQESKDYDDFQVGTLVFSPNSERLAYCARKSSEWRVFHEGGAFQALEGVAEGSPIFSPDSKKVAYVAFSRQNKAVIMLDGRPCGEFDAIGEKTPVWSPDSQHLAYAAKLKGKWWVYVDDKAYGPYTAVAEGTPIYNRDGKRLVWCAQNGNVWSIYENGTELTLPPKPPKKKGDPIVSEFILKGTPLFSPDGKKLVVGLRRNGGWVLWMQGEESERYDDIADGSIRFSLDSKRLAFVGMRDKKPYAVFNFKETGPCLETSPTRISRGEPSGALSIAVRRQRTPEQVSAAKKRDPDAGESYWQILVNGEEMFDPFNAVQQGALSVSYDGTRFAIPANTKEGWGIWINGERRTDGLPIWMRFNPTSHLLEMIAVAKEGYMLLREVYD